MTTSSGLRELYLKELLVATTTASHYFCLTRAFVNAFLQESDFWNKNNAKKYALNLHRTKKRNGCKPNLKTSAVLFDVAKSFSNCESNTDDRMYPHLHKPSIVPHDDVTAKQWISYMTRDPVSRHITEKSLHDATTHTQCVEFPPSNQINSMMTSQDDDAQASIVIIGRIRWTGVHELESIVRRHRSRSTLVSDKRRDHKSTSWRRSPIETFQWFTSANVCSSLTGWTRSGQSRRSYDISVTSWAETHIRV